MDTTVTAFNIDALRAWVGRSEKRSDLITAAPLAGLAATLDRTSDAAPVAGSVLPPLAHWLYFLPVAMQSEIGPDGHPKRGGFLPPVPLPRRMWAGGRFEFKHPLKVVTRRCARPPSNKSTPRKARAAGWSL